MSARSTKTPFRYMKQFKAIAMDYEYFASLSDEGQLYCLSDQQVYIILAQLDYVGWLTRWYNTDDITQTTVDRIKSDLMEAVMSCVDVQILVDQANENLITTVTNRALQSQAIRDVLASEYDGNPTSINPNAPTSTWSYGGTEDGEASLCAALTAFVYQFARSQADSVRAGQVGGLAAISLIAALLIPGLNIFFLVGAGIAVLLGLGVVGVTTEVAITALTDTDALDAVICCMRDNLLNADVNETTWSNSLGGCGFAGGSNAQIVADFIGATMADNYLTFLDFMGTGYVGVTGGEAVPSCPCEPGVMITLTPFGYAGQTFGSFPGEVESGVSFNAMSTSVVGSYATDRVICAIFSQACIISVNLVTAWEQCTFSGTDAVYGYCPTHLDPNNFANWIFGRLNGGVTEIPISWDQPANGVWFEGCVAGQFTVNMKLTAI